MTDGSHMDAHRIYDLTVFSLDLSHNSALITITKY